VEKNGIPVPDRAARDVRLGDLTHGDRGLDPGVDAFLLQEVLQRKAVHHDAEHAHVVGPGPVHPALLQLGTAEEVAATDHHGHLDAGAHRLGHLPRDGPDDVRVDTDPAAAEGLPRELEQHPVVAQAVRPVLILVTVQLSRRPGTGRTR
jgi:hypothetical protein